MQADGLAPLVSPLNAGVELLRTTMTEQSVEGMTVNERLFHFGLSLIDQFDAAVISGDVSAIVRVLMQARFSEAQATQTAQAVAST